MKNESFDSAEAASRSAVGGRIAKRLGRMVGRTGDPTPSPYPQQPGEAKILSEPEKQLLEGLRRAYPNMGAEVIIVSQVDLNDPTFRSKS